MLSVRSVENVPSRSPYYLLLPDNGGTVGHFSQSVVDLRTVEFAMFVLLVNENISLFCRLPL
jgi:hypothetical protein